MPPIHKGGGMGTSNSKYMSNIEPQARDLEKTQMDNSLQINLILV